MKKILLENKTAGVNPAAIIDKDGSVIVDYCTTINEKGGSIWDHLNNMLKDGPAWDHLDEMLGE